MKTRRDFLRTAALGAAVLPVAPRALAAFQVPAEELPRLGTDSPQAVDAGYVQDARRADAARGYRPGQACANCNLVSGEPKAEWRSCGMFPGQAVAAAGWCRHYGVGSGAG